MRVLGFLSLLSLGGLKMILYKIEDKFTRGRKVNSFLYDILSSTPEIEYPKMVKRIYQYQTNKRLNLQKPMSYNEKIQWLKVYDSSQIKTQIADKYTVRKWVQKKIGDEFLIPLLGVWDSFDEIDFDLLPNSFVLKCNHGSGYNVVIKNKANYNVENLKPLFEKWLKTNFAFADGVFEPHYRDISPKIIAEQYIEQLDGNLFDYKIHVFNGVPKIIQVIGDRDFKNHSAKEAFFDCKWNQIDLMYHTYSSFDILPAKPQNLDELLSISSKLGEGFKYVRVDLYNINNQILFGELTFTPAGGYAKWNGKEELLVGSWIDIDPK